MFIIMLKYVKPLEEVDRVLAAHQRFLEENYSTRRFLASGPRVPRTGAVILVQAESEAALREEMARDPFITSGVAEYEIVEFTPTRLSPWLFGHLG